MIIGLPYRSTKFRSISIKPYFINDPKLVLDSLALAEISQTEIPSADISPIKPAAKSPLATLASLASVKQGYGRPRKYPE